MSGRWILLFNMYIEIEKKNKIEEEIILEKNWRKFPLEFKGIMVLFLKWNELYMIWIFWFLKQLILMKGYYKMWV
jgi:hypothetical protein